MADLNLYLPDPPKFYEYESPIEVIYQDIYHRINVDLEDNIYKAVINCGIQVDKEELIKALKYDREQYDKGRRSGYQNGVIEFVEYLKRHSCKYGLENHHYFEAIDIEDLDNLVDGFLYGV